MLTSSTGNVKNEDIEDDESDFEGSECITSYSEPPVLSSLAFEEIIEIADSGDNPRHIYDLSCHNQRVE